MTSRYYTMTDSTGESGFLPTVKFTSTDNVFTSAQRIAQLASIPGTPIASITGLYEADFSGNITTIDTDAFLNDTQVVVVTINKVTTIGANAFKGCSALRSITLDCAVDANKKYLLTTIGTNAFQSCTSLRHLHIPDTVRIIPDYMCDGCTNLEFAVIGYGWDRTGDTYNTSFNSVNNKIGSYAFNSCTNLSYFVVPETMAEIGNNAFANCSSLALVNILGTPTVGAAAFSGAMGSGAIYYYNTTNNISDSFPAGSSIRAYTEVTFSETGELQTSTAVSALTNVNSYWKGKILSGVTTIGTDALPAVFRPAAITAAKYSNMIGMSFPSSLTAIRYGAFEAWVTGSNPGTWAPCNVTAFYFPNSVVSFPLFSGASAAFRLGVDSNRIASSTRQFVFLSGTNTVTFGPNMFQDNSARAFIIPTITNIANYCFYYTQNAYFFSFFQKNAYSLLTAIGNDSQYVLEGCFKRGVTGYRHYVYIHKQVTSIGVDAFRAMAEKLVVNVYHNSVNSAGVTQATGLGAGGYIRWHPTALGYRFNGTTPTFHIVYNNYNAAGTLLAAANVPGDGFAYHLLYSPYVTTIATAFGGAQYLRSVAIDHNAVQTVTINDEAYKNCTYLNFVYLNNRVKIIGYNAFRNIQLSSSFDLIDASPLEQIHHAAFFTDNITCNLSQITIPKSVKILGSFAFASQLGFKTSFTTLSFENGIEFWGDYDNNNNLGASSAIANFGTLNSSNVRHMAIPWQFCINCDYLRNVSFLNTALDQAGTTPVPNDGLALARQDNSRPMLTRYNTQILNPPIKRISNGAFHTNHRLQSIRIPEGVTTIDSNAFFETYSLTYLYLPDTLTSIALNAFSKMNFDNKFSYTGKEVSVRVPQSRIDDVANASVIKFNPTSVSTYFINVSYDNTSASGKVTSGVLGRFTTSGVDPYIRYHVVIQSGITGILGGTTGNARAFDGYSSLKTVTIPDSVTNIGVAAFYNCTGLTDAFISSTTSLTAINESVFHNCSSLTGGFSLGSWLITIGINAFRNARLSNSFDLSSASNLQAIYFGAFTTEVGYTSNIKQITIPNSVKVLAANVFDCSQSEQPTGLKPFFTSLSFQNGITFLGDYNATLTNASTTAAYGTDNSSNARYMAIPSQFCRNCNLLTSINWLDTVDANGNAIPADASGVLVRPNNSLPIPTRYNKQILNPLINRIGQNAFYRNTRLQSIRVPDGVKTVDVNAFYDAYSVTYLYLPDSLTTVGLAAFNYVGAVNQFGYTGKEVSVRIPQGLIDLVVPDTLNNNTGYFNSNDTATRYFTVAFDNTSSKVTNGVLGRFTNQAVNTYIKYHIIIQNGITGILGSGTANTRAFDGHTGLKTVTIADTVTNIGWYSFNGCTGLTNVFISPTSNVTVLEYAAFLNCTALTSFFIPNSLKVIETSVFNNTGLTSVIYGDNPGLKFIGHASFYNSTKTLASIFIPSSVVHIGSDAFITNSNTDINILNTVTFGAGSRLKSIDYKCFGNDGNGIPRAAQYLQDLVLPNGLRYMGPTNTGNSSPLQNTHRLAHSANLVVPSSMEVIPWAFLYADGSTVDISNVYFPLSINTVAGPRIHNGYSLSGGLIGAEFFASRSGSLIYLPSELSAYTTRATYAFPSTDRARSFYKTVSFTGNSLASLGLGLSVANTTDAAQTSQIHANIQEGVIVIGGGTSIAGTGNSLRNLISVNIPSTVTDICANAFNGCSALVYVTFSENSHLTTIGNSAFLGCSMIHDIQLPDSLTTIGANAFNGCYNLASISIPYNVTSIGAGAFNVNSSSPTTYIPRQKGYHADQLGGDIYGEAVSDFSGYSVSLSQDGKILAIGSPLNDAGGGDAGHVRVYKYQTITDTTWVNYTVNSFFQNGSSPYNKPIVVNGGDVLPIANKYYWVQLGSDINGEGGYNFAGHSVSLSADGLTVAIGALVNYGAGGDAGHVRVYKYQTITDASWNSYTINSFTYNGTAPTNKPIIANGGDSLPVSGKYYWAQLGGDIDGETVDIQSGNSVSLSSNGQIVAIGARFDDTNGKDSGGVRLYQYNGSNWNKLGSTILGGATALDTFGNSVSLSDDGTIVAIAAQYFDSPGFNDAGIVRIYKYISNDWTQLGNTIMGEAVSDYAGESVSLNSNGTIVAIGAVGNDGGGTDSGHVRVYTWNGSSWIKLGQDIDGAAAYDHFGNSVSLSSDGTILAVGSRYSDTTGSIIDTGMVRIYKYFNGTWQKLGQDIRGESISEITGCSVSLSRDGTTVAVGAYGADGNGHDSGRVRVYQISNFTVRMHQRLYDTIHASFSTYFPGISPGSVQVIPALTLTNTLNPAKLTISQINNMYIRYRQSQLGCTKVKVAATSGGTLTTSDVTNAISGTTGLVHLDISTNVINVEAEVCLNNLRIYSVAIPKTVTNIRFSAFNGCQNLSYLSFHPDSVCTTIGYAAVHNTNIIDLALPDSLITIGESAFQSSWRLTLVCIPKNVTSLGSQAFHNCPKLTSVALPTQLSTAATSSYFNTNGTTVPGSFTIYETSTAIPHFKLSEYSTPNGIVQTVIDSAVKYIDNLAYAYYPDITLYAVTTNKQTQTAGPINYVMNGIKMPFQPATFIINPANGWPKNSMFPLFRSVPDLNVFTLSDSTGNWVDDSDDYYILMPEYSICIYNNLYEEENLFWNASASYRYYDNEFGTTPLNINIQTGMNNTTSSILIMYKGRILSKYFTN